MKKSTIRKILAGALAAAAVTGGTIAASNKKNVDIYYNGITIMIDGAEYVAKDANGNTVAPFIMDGTTYLPVRAVANAFDKDVEWDGKTSTVYIGKKDRMKPDNRLDKIQYVDYYEADEHSDFFVIHGTVDDYLGNTYTNGLLFKMYYGHSDNKNKEGCKSYIDYPLNGQYEELSGTVVLPKQISIAGCSSNNPKVKATDIVFYGDDEEIYRIRNVISTMPYDFNVDVEGINMLRVEIDVQHDITSSHYVALTDLALYE